MNAANPMREIRIEKLTLNVGCGDDKQKIERATKLLQMLTENRPVVTLSRTRSTFGVVKGKPIGVKVTLRKKRAEEFFKLLLSAKEKKMSAAQLDKEGNVNLGVKEYIELPGMKYSHDVGMLGFGVSVTLERKGYRVAKRKARKTNIGKKHKINKEEVLNWLQQRYGVQIV